MSIIDTEKNYKKRCFSEMLNIYIYNNHPNKVRDTQYLKQIYKHTIDLIQYFYYLKSSGTKGNSSTFFIF